MSTSTKASIRYAIILRKQGKRRVTLSRIEVRNTTTFIHKVNLNYLQICIFYNLREEKQKFLAHIVHNLSISNNL